MCAYVCMVCMGAFISSTIQEVQEPNDEHIWKSHWSQVMSKWRCPMKSKSWKWTVQNAGYCEDTGYFALFASKCYVPTSSHTQQKKKGVDIASYMLSIHEEYLSQKCSTPALHPYMFWDRFPRLPAQAERCWNHWLCIGISGNRSSSSIICRRLFRTSQLLSRGSNFMRKSWPLKNTWCHLNQWLSVSTGLSRLAWLKGALITWAWPGVSD